MKDFLMQTYTIVLPVLLGYIVWLLKRQKKDRDANSKGMTVIFCIDKQDYGRKIANLVKVIGQDELIRRTGGMTKTITFKLITKLK